MDDIKRLLWEAWTGGWECAGCDCTKRFEQWFETIDFKAWVVAGKVVTEFNKES